MKKGIAFFDFDGTITTRDTFLEFIKYSKGHWAFWTGFLFLSPYLIAFKAGLISNQKAKECVLRYYFKGVGIADFNLKCKAFAEAVIPNLLRPKAIERIQWHKEQGMEVVLVSASPENWLQDWCESMGIRLIGTQLEVHADLLTGNVRGRNCHGEEKVRRIREKFNLSDYQAIYAYGDTSGDRPMLGLAQFPFMKEF